MKNFRFAHEKRRRRRELIIFALFFCLIIFGLVFYRLNANRPWEELTIKSLGGFLSKQQDIFWSLSSLGEHWKKEAQLISENKSLKNQLDELRASLAAKNLTLNNYQKIAEIFPAENEDLIMAEILARPNVTLYDTVLLNRGTKDGVARGAKIFGYHGVVLGEITDVYENTAKAKLYSSPEEKSLVSLIGAQKEASSKKNPQAGLIAVGEGGGVFRLQIHREIPVAVGDFLVLEGLNNHLLAEVASIKKDDRDPAQEILAHSLVNLNEINFLGIEKTKTTTATNENQQNP